MYIHLIKINPDQRNIMLKTLKQQVRGFLFGVLVTVLLIGCLHVEIRFSAGPQAYELSQSEQVAEKLAAVMPQEKPRVR